MLLSFSLSPFTSDMQILSDALRFLSNIWERMRKCIHNSPSPSTWTMQNGLHVCANCNYTFAGNFCPRCGQSRHGGNRLTIRLTLKRAFDVWGLGNRSLPRTILHLFYRPGFMIQDYLKGKRQAYFPPFKMLFLLTALYTTILYYLPSAQEGLLDSDIFNTNIITETKEETQITQSFLQQATYYIKFFLKTCTEHRAAALILIHSLFAISTFLLFRHSPSLPKLSISEHFFSQIFISCQLLTLSILVDIITRNTSQYLFYSIPNLLILAIVCYDYWQLYGYSLIRTLWKTLLSFLFSFLVLSVICIALACYLLSETISNAHL